MKSRFSLCQGLLLGLLAVTAFTLACTPPFYELPYDSSTYCGKCDVTCSTCSGTSINSCASCPSDFTLNSTTSTCIAPSSTAISTPVSLYHSYGFELESSWTAPSGVYSCNSISVVKGVSGDVVSVDHTLSKNYKVRILVSLWLFSGGTGITMSMKNKVTNGVVLTQTVTPVILADVTASAYEPYCSGSKAINYNYETLNTATSVTVSFTSTSALWGIRQYVLIQYLCSQPDCQTCVGPAATQCVTCNDVNKKMYATPSGPCLCKFQSGYYAYPTGNTTYYCVNKCPNFLSTGQYYGDNTTKTCVATCPAVTGAPQWGLSFASDLYGRCVQTCDPFIQLQSGVNTPVFYDKTNKKCTIKCPDSQPYSWWVDRACYANCPADNSGKQYYKLTTNMSCVDICPNVTQGSTVAIPLYIDNTTNSCVTECDSTIGYWGYLDPTTGVRSCIYNCPHGYFRDQASGRPLCTKVCPAPDWFGDFNTLPPACVQTCSFGTYGDQMSSDRYCVSKCNGSYYGLRTGDRTCIQNCPTGTWGEPDTLTCATSAFQCLSLNLNNPYTGTQTLIGAATFSASQFSFADSYLRKCIFSLSACSVGQFKYNSTYLCLPSCPFGSYANNLTYWCVDKCYGDYFADNQTNYCAKVCSPGYYADRGSAEGNKCVRNCNQSGGFPFRDDNVRQCVAVCTAGYADKLAESCVFNCTPPLYLNNSVPTELTCIGHCGSPYFAFNNSDSGICLITCPDEPPQFGDVLDGYRLCVEVCQMGTYGDQTDGSVRWCVAHCPNHTFAQNDTLRRCVTRCSDGTYGREADWACVAATDCPENYTGDPTTNMCVQVCPISAGTFADNISKLCISRCPVAGSVIYYADQHTRWCIPTCDATYSQFGNNSTQTCQPKCLDRNSFADAQNTRRYCIDECTWLSGVKYYRNNQTGTCVVSTGCTGTYAFSSSASYTEYYFADNFTLYCVQKCPNITGVPSWGYVPTLTCVALCFTETYGDNSTGIPLCVSLCSEYPTPLWAYDGPGDKSVMLCKAVCPAPYFGQDYARTCVEACPRQNGTHLQTYAYDGTRRCLLTCPDTTWSDYISGVCFHYPVNCTAPCSYSNNSCTSYRWASDYNNSCVYECNSSPWDQFGDNLTQKCTDRCSVLSYADNETGTRICVARCPGEYTSSGDVTTIYDSYGDNNTQSCVRHCQEPGTFADWQLSLCLFRCMGDNEPLFQPTYANIFSKRCVIALYCPTVPDLYFGQNITRTCQPACPLNSSYVSFADNITRSCIPQCYLYTNASTSVNTTFYGDTSTDRPVCVISCPSSPRLFGQNVTNLCQAECPDHQYGDQTGNRSCVPVCPNINNVTWFSQLTQRICVVVCEEATWGNYYNSIGPHCETVGTDCNQTQYGDNSTHMCVPLCPESMNYFGQPSTKLCTDKCPYLSNSTHTLVNATAGINLTEGRLFADYKTRLCVYTCPADFGLQGTFGDNSTNTCVQRCPRGSYGDANTVNRFCVATCTGGAFADDLTMLCVDICPFSPPTFGYEGNWTCLKTCPSQLWANSNTRKCEAGCSPSFRLTLTSNTCVGVCPSDPDLYGDTTDYNCTAVCSNGQFADPTDRLCKSSCSPLFQYGFRCVRYCPEGYFANADLNCVVPAACNGSTYGDNSTTECVGTCPSGSFADPVSKYCIAVCPDHYYGDDKVCVQNCTTPGTVASNISQLCEGICPNYTYGYQGECYPDCSGLTYQNDVSHLCDSSCPANQFADPVSHRCVEYCPSGYYRKLTTLVNSGLCVLQSSGCSPLFSDFVTGYCVSKCSSGYWGYTGNYTCNRGCPSGSGQYGYQSSTERTCYLPNNIPGSPTMFGDSESGEFVSVCPETPVLTFGDVNRQLCVEVCQAYAGVDYYGDPATRRCQSSCQDPTHYTADPATWLCTLRCTYGTFRHNATSPICVTNCPAGYGDFSSRICVATCGQLTNTFGYNNLTSGYKVCLIQCPAGLYSEPLQRTCIAHCPGTLGVTTMYYAYNGTRECMTYCNDSFADDSNNICVGQCLSGSYPNADNSTNRCVFTCPDDPDLYADNHVCVHYCGGGYYADSKDRICASRCSNMSTYTQYGDPRTGRCVMNCSQGTWGDNSTNLCVKTCPSGSFADNSSGKCVAQCPKDQNIYADMLLHVCSYTCSGGRFGSQINQTCLAVCDNGYYGDPTTTLCTDLCPVKIYSYGQNVTRTCVVSCVGWIGSDGVQGYADNYSRLCRDKCQMTLAVETYADPTTKACVQRCPWGYFMQNNTNVCLVTCPNNTFADNFSSFCVSQCPDSPQSYGDTQLHICTYTCLGGYFSDNSTNLCVFECPSTPEYFGDQLTGRCVFWCSEGTYAENGTRRCLGTCPPTTFADNLTRKCVSDCPPSEWTFADESTHRCVRICPLGHFAENSTQACQPSCWNYSVSLQSYADNISNFCVAQCPFGFFGDNTTHECVLRCSTTRDEYGHPVGRVCVAQLDCYPDNATGNIYYADSTTRRCVQKCPLTLWADSHIFVCVPTCNATLPEFRNLHTQQCVWPCPSDPDQYADTANGNCVRTCTPGTYAYTVNRTCQSSCLPFSLFADNSTQRCQLSCNHLPYYYADPLIYKCVYNCSGGYFADNRTQSCVPVCPVEWALFGQKHNYTCVSLCPDGEYSDALDSRICTLTCSNSYFADSFTSSCVPHCRNIRPSWFEDTSTGKNICVEVCPGESYGYTVDQTCKYLSGSVSTCPDNYYADRTSRLCVQFCPNSTYAHLPTKYCEYTCSGSYYADPVLRKCVPTCSPNLFKYELDININLCVQYCRGGLYAMNASGGNDSACVPVCWGMLGVQSTWTCEGYCPSPYYGDWDLNLCRDNCTPNFAFMPNRTCLAQCDQPYYGNSLLSTCDLLCPLNYFGENTTRMCSPNCPNDSYADPSIRVCVAECPAHPSLFADDRTNQCLPRCQAPLFSYDPTRQCVSSCPNITLGAVEFRYLADPFVRGCVLQCNNQPISFADYGNNICTKLCPSLYYADNYTNQCVPVCPNIPNDTYSDNTSRICMDVCLPGSFGYQPTLNCVEFCWWPYFADPTTRTCVQYCPNGYFSDNSTATCKSQCPSGSFADPVTHRCLGHCPALHNYFDYSGNWTCLQTCPPGFYSNTDLGQCVSICNSSSSMFSYSPTNQCVRECPIPYRGYPPNNTCLLSCPSVEYFYDVTINQCSVCHINCSICVSLSTCKQCKPGFNLFNGYCNQSCIPTNVITYANSLGVCVLVCPPGSYGNNVSYACVADGGCPVQQYGNSATHLCTLCPYTCTACTSETYCSACQSGATLAIDNMCYGNCNSTHVYSYNGVCYNICPTGSYLTYTNVLCGACATTCYTCWGSATNCTSCQASYHYGSTCLPTCPAGFYGDAATLSCLNCSAVPSSACTKPLTYTTAYSVQNFQSVITLQFNQNVTLLKDLASILKIKLVATRLLQIGTLVNDGITYTYEILSNGTIKIYLDVGISLTQPTFTVDISDPSAVISESGVTLQNVQSLLSLEKIDYYPPADGSEAGTNFPATFTAVVFLLLFAATFVFSDVMVRPLQLLQLLFLHCLIDSPISANLYYLLSHLKLATLSFTTNWFSSSFPTPSPYYSIPLKIKDNCVDYIFLRNVGQIFVYIVILACFWVVFLLLGNKRIVTHKIWLSFFSEVSEKRFKNMLVNDVVSLFYLPITYFGFWQMNNLFGEGIYGFNGFATLFFTASAIAVPVIWLGIWCKRQPEDIHNTMWFLTLRVKSPEGEIPTIHDHKSEEQLKGSSEGSVSTPISQAKNSYQTETMVFYLYLLFCSIWMVGLYSSVIAQLVLLIITNIIFLLYLLKSRPYLNKINLIFMILFVLTAITLEAFFLYFYETDSSTYASQKTATAFPLVVTICVVLILMILWGLWRVVWQVSFFVGNFKRTLLYLQFADHDYVGEQEQTQKYSQYDKLAQKMEVGVGDILIEHIQQALNEEGEKVIKVTKKKLVKKARAKGRKRQEFPAEQEEASNLEFVRVNQINVFDYNDQLDEPERKEPEVLVKNRRKIDDDIRDLVSDGSGNYDGVDHDEQEKKIDVQPGEVMVRNIDDLSNIDHVTSEKQSEYPFVGIEPQENDRKGSQQQKKNDSVEQSHHSEPFDFDEPGVVKQAPKEKQNQRGREEEYSEIKSSSLFDDHHPEKEEKKEAPEIFSLDLQEPEEQGSLGKEPQKEKKVVNLQDLMEEEEGKKKKNLLFLFDDFEQ